MSPVPPETTPVCQKDEFQCSNGRCISSNLRCDYFNNCEDYGSDEIGCNKKGVSHLGMQEKCARVVSPVCLCVYMQLSVSLTLYPVSSCSDSALNDCRSNRTVCGDGDEAHCVVNGTEAFCACKLGFQTTGNNRCEGTL